MTSPEKVIKQRNSQLELIAENDRKVEGNQAFDQMIDKFGPRPELIQKQKILNKLIENRMQTKIEAKRTRSRIQQSKMDSSNIDRERASNLMDDIYASANDSQDDQ